VNIDSVFLPLAETLIEDVFPTAIVYRRDEGSTYDPATGTVTPSITDYDINAGSSTKVDASAPLILQQYPELVDMLSCWSATSTGAGKVILRVRS
jgi:hypothetical protein